MRSVVGCDLTFASMVWKWVQQVVILAGSQIKRVVKYTCWRVKQVVLLDEYLIDQQAAANLAQARLAVPLGV